MGFAIRTAAMFEPSQPQCLERRSILLGSAKSITSRSFSEASKTVFAEPSRICGGTSSANSSRRVLVASPRKPPIGVVRSCVRSPSESADVSRLKSDWFVATG